MSSSAWLKSEGDRLQVNVVCHRLALVMAFLMIDSHGSPGTPHATREECFEIIDSIVRHAIAHRASFGSSSMTSMVA
jgi:hypothetical protein